MLRYARYELTTPLPPEEVCERLSRHTIHWRFGRFPLSDPEVPREELHFIGRVSADSFRLQLHDDEIENTSHAVARGRIVAGPEGTRIEVRSGPAFVTWFMMAAFVVGVVPAVKFAVVCLSVTGFRWEWVSMVVMGLVFVGVIPWSLMRGWNESKQFRRRLTALLRPRREAAARGERTA